MHSIDRRTFLKFSALGMALVALPVSASPKSDDISDKVKFIKNANKQWLQDYKKEEAAEIVREKHGEFSSLAPPQQLIPFKDWDYYYTKGNPEVWAPNPGQKFSRVIVPEGFVTDLASVPQWLWSSGYRPEGPYAYAAIIHDYLYWTQERPRAEADLILKFAMEDSKVSPSSVTKIYEAVHLLGRHAWEQNAKLKKAGEHRILRKFPTDFTITWSEWKKKPGVFRD